MHLAILTIPHGIPAIAISYNGLKAAGTFNHWNIAELVIDPKNINQITKVLLIFVTIMIIYIKKLLLVKKM